MSTVMISRFFASLAINEEANVAYYSGSLKDALSSVVPLFPELNNLTSKDIEVLTIASQEAAVVTDDMERQLIATQVIAALTGNTDPLD